MSDTHWADLNVRSRRHSCRWRRKARRRSRLKLSAVSSNVATRCTNGRIPFRTIYRARWTQAALLNGRELVELRAWGYDEPNALRLFRSCTSGRALPVASAQRRTYSTGLVFMIVGIDHAQRDGVASMMRAVRQWIQYDVLPATKSLASSMSRPWEHSGALSGAAFSAS